jgi:hypothetical protein
MSTPPEFSSGEWTHGVDFNELLRRASQHGSVRAKPNRVGRYADLPEVRVGIHNRHDEQPQITDCDGRCWVVNVGEAAKRFYWSEMKNGAASAWVQATIETIRNMVEQ